MRKQTSEVRFKALLSISRISGTDESTPMRITIEDEASGCRIVEASFSLEGFMRALTSQSDVEGNGILWRGPVGFKHQHKEEIVPRPKSRLASSADRDALRPFEVDGWRGDVSDMHNHHRWQGDNQVRVLFRRYVNDAGEIWESKA